MRIKLTSREIALLALLSTIWAAIEVNLGILLRSLQIPFKGGILTFFALIVLFIGRDLVPKRGAVLMMGMTTAFIKFIFLGGMAIYPVIGILMEVILVEIFLFKTLPRSIHFHLAGAAGLGWSFVHPFFTQGLLAGWGILKVYEIFVERGAALFGFDQNPEFIFFALLFMHLIPGAIAGGIGYKISQLIIQRYHKIPASKIDASE